MRIRLSLALFVATWGLAAGAQAHHQVMEFDQDATPEVIFGTGNFNGSFTVQRKNGVEVALRVKERFPASNNFFSNGDGTYSVPKGNPCPGGFGFSPTCMTTPLWSFEWSVNTDYNGTTGKKLSDFTYELGMDADSKLGAKYTIFDNITPSLVAPLFDHAIGDNSTPNGGGTTAGTDPVVYQNLLDSNNVAQNSWNYEFFNNLGTTLEFFDPNVKGNYIIFLRVKNPAGNVVAQTFIQVLVGNANPKRRVRLPRPRR